LLFAIILSTLCYAAPAPNEELLVEELNHAMAHFEALGERPHYAALTLLDVDRIAISSSWGEVRYSDQETGRFLDVDLRVGTASLDATHALRGISALDGMDRVLVKVPFENTPETALRLAIVTELERQFDKGRERLALLEAELAVKVLEEDQAADFTSAPVVISRTPTNPISLDVPRWETTLQELALTLRDDPLIHDAMWKYTLTREEKLFVDTEGSRILHGSTNGRISLFITTTLQDGDDVSLLRSLDIHDPTEIPDSAALQHWNDEIRTDFYALIKAPRGKPYSGPVLLSGKASGVFFHEVFGHRVEGHRQKLEDEGKTFGDRVGQRILPEYITIIDDPTLASVDGVSLNGYYAYDDEGVAPTPTTLVESGAFVGFLMGRTPISGFEKSNGHGRRSTGNAPTSRMGNTMISSTKSVPLVILRSLLIKEARAQGLEYGLIVDKIAGGFTTTGRTTPNAFSVRAVMSRRVYVDGRPDEIIRGIDLIGTPLLAFQDILATSTERSIFNGVCGAESGWVPVSAVSPAILVRTLETQRKEKGIEQPPALPKPLAGGAL
jgi:TldD protein